MRGALPVLPVSPPLFASVLRSTDEALARRVRTLETLNTLLHTPSTAELIKVLKAQTAQEMSSPYLRSLVTEDTRTLPPARPAEEIEDPVLLARMTRMEMIGFLPPHTLAADAEPERSWFFGDKQLVGCVVEMDIPPPDPYGTDGAIFAAGDVDPLVVLSLPLDLEWIEARLNSVGHEGERIVLPRRRAEGEAQGPVDDANRKETGAAAVDGEEPPGQPAPKRLPRSARLQEQRQRQWQAEAEAEAEGQ